MSFWNHYPYTDFHEINLDWIIGILKEMEKKLEDFVSTNSIKYANPFQWSIVNQYEKNTLVIEPNTGTAYLSVQAVPQGVNISNVNYWTPVFELTNLFGDINKNFTGNDEQLNVYSSANYAVGSWLLWHDKLYKVISAITAGDALAVGTNIEQITIESVISLINSAIAQLNSDVSDLAETIEDYGYINVKAFGAVGDGNTDDTAAIKAAVTELNTNGGVLYFPAGHYVLNDTLNITKTGAHVKGAGNHATYILQHNDGDAFVFGTGTLPALNGVCVEDIGIINMSATLTNAIGIHLNYCVNCYINNVLVVNYSKGIKFNHTGNSFITNTGVTSNRSGAIAFYMGDTSVSNSLNNVYAGFSGLATDTGIGLYDFDSNIADLNVNYLDVGAGAYGVYIDGQNSPASFPPADIRLHEIVSDGARYSAIFIQNINAQGNVNIEGGWLNPEKTGTSKCIDIKNANNINIHDAVLQQLADEAPVIVGIALDTVVSVNIDNVQFINMKSSIAAYGCDRVNFKNNEVTLYASKSSTDYAVNLSNCYNMIVTGNAIYGAFARGIYQGGTGDYLVATSNIVRGTSDPVHTNATNNAIANNITA